MSTVALLSGGAVFVGVFLLVVALAGTSERATRQRQLEMVLRYGRGRVTTEAERKNAGDKERASIFSRIALRTAERALEGRGRRQRLAAQLDLAGIAMRPGEWLVLRVCSALAAGVVLAVVGPGFVGFLLGLVAGWFGPQMLVRMKINKRRRAFADDLVDMLQLVAGSLRSGFSLAQALGAAAREGRDPMKSEIGRALAEARVGTPLDDALMKIAGRMGSEDFEWVVMAIRIQREVGGNLAEILLTTAATLRERSFLMRHVRSLSAEGRLSGYILMALPVAIGGFLALFRTEYIAPMWSTSMGYTMIAVMLVSLTIGALWMRKLAQVKI